MHNQNPEYDPEWDSDKALEVRETGLASFPTPNVDPNSRDALPAGGGRFAIPPHLGFVSLINQPFRSHHWSIDEALKNSRANCDAMLKDALINYCLEKRFEAASQVSWHIEPLDETDNAQVKAAIKNTLAVSKTFQLREAFYHLHFAKWYGKYGLGMVYEWDKYQPDLMRCKEWTPINGDSLVARWSTREYGQLVNAQYDGPTEAYSLSRVHYYTPAERESVVIHQWRSRQPDFFDSLSSGQLAGVGLRHATYWMWYYRANLLALLMDYTERLAGGIWKGWFDESNPEARTSLEQAVAGYKSKHLLSLPRRRDGTPVCDLEIMEVGAASAGIIQQAIAYIDGLIREYLTGQPSHSGNIGGDEVAMRDDSLSGTTKSDANTLAEDLTVEWLPTLYRYNTPGIPPGRFVFDTDSPNADRLLNYAVTMQQLGWAVDLDHLASVTGLPKASLDANVSTKIQPLSPTAIESPPQSVPVAQSPATSPSAAPTDNSQPAGVPAQ